jgi:hypothetical protein
MRSEDVPNSSGKNPNLTQIKELLRRQSIDSFTALKEPVMDALQIPFVALFTGMVLSFMTVMIIETILEARQG